ncbi:MAG: ORF6N domain-containing protein [Patescibacteria group bacterium]|jgi:hypothetical protein
MVKIIPYENIKAKIYLIRGQKVMIDRDLALLYGVETGALNRGVKRNTERFPSDFMFQLTKKEFENLKCQIGISSCKNSEDKPNLKSQIATSSWGGTRKMPYAFTEHGVAMLSSVLKSERSVEINIAIIRTFIKLRDFALSYKALAEKINELERGIKKHDKKITEIFAALRLLARDEEKAGREEIGFKAV